MIDRVLLEPRVNVLRQRWGCSPRCSASQRALRGDRCVLALGENSDKAAVAHYRDDTGNRICLGVVERVEPGETMRWADHAAVEHPRQDQVLDETRSARDLVREITPRAGNADHPAPSWQTGERSILFDIAVEQALIRAFPIARASTDRAHCPVLHFQNAERNAKALRRTLEQKCPGVRARAPQSSAGILNREAARGHPFVRAEGSIGRNHANALERYPQLLRGDLGEGGQDPLADFHLAAEDRDRAVAFEPQPLGKPRALLETAGTPEAGVGDGVHVRSPAATRNTARTMRLCEPQRHKLRSKAARTSLSVGVGFLARSAAALIRMPLVQ